MNKIIQAFKLVSSDLTSIIVGIFGTLIFLILSVLSQFLIIPGFPIDSPSGVWNVLRLWWTVTPFFSKVLALLLGVAVGVLLSLLAYSLRLELNLKQSTVKAGTGAVAGGTGVMAVLIGTAGCTTCLAPIFGFLGVGALITLTNFQQPVLAAGLLLVLAAIYFSAVPIAKRCPNGSCVTSPRKKKG